MAQVSRQNNEVIAPRRPISARLRNHLGSSLVAYIALFLSLSAPAYSLNGSLPGKNTVGSADIINGEVKSADVGSDQIRSADVRDDSLKGGGLLSKDIANESLTASDIRNGSLGSGDIADASLSGADIADASLSGGDINNDSLLGLDINEATLAKVPAARTADNGGTGRYAWDGGCNPESSTYLHCGTLYPVPLSEPGRILVTATVRAESMSGTYYGSSGVCRIAVNGVVYTTTDTSFRVDPYEVDNGSLIAVTDVLPGGNHVLAVQCNQGGGSISYSRVKIVAVTLSAN